MIFPTCCIYSLMILPYVRTENECQKERFNRLKKQKWPSSRMTSWDGPSSSQPGDHTKRSNLEGGKIRHKLAGMKTSYPSTNNTWLTWTTWHSGCLMLTHISVYLNHVLPFLHRYALLIRYQSLVFKGVIHTCCFPTAWYTRLLAGASTSPVPCKLGP